MKLRDRLPLVLAALLCASASAFGAVSLSTFFALGETSAPSVSGASEARFYADSATHALRVSANGGAYSAVPVDGGNSLGATLTLGTNDVQSLALESSGTTRVTLTATTLTSTLPITLPVGATTATSVNFTSDPNTGLYSPGADSCALVTGGTARFTLSTTAMTTTLPLRGQDGTASAPSLSFSGDTNCGVFRATTDVLGFSTAGSERARINAAGELLLGTSTAITGFEFVNAGDSIGTSWAFSSSGVDLASFVAADAVNGAAAAGTRLRPDVSTKFADLILSPNGSPAQDNGLGVGSVRGELQIYSQDITGGGDKNAFVFQVGTTGITYCSLATNAAGSPILPLLFSGYDGNTISLTAMMEIDPAANEITLGSNASVKLGFYNATPISKPTVTGSRGGNAALADLLQELQNLGLITDSSS